MPRWAKKMTTLMVLACAGACVSCGLDIVDSGSGSSGTPGDLVAQAEFTAVGDVDGIASIYRKSSGGFVLRLSSLSAPSASHSVRVNSSDGVVLSTTLGTTSGTKDFSFTADEDASFISVEIFQGGTVHGTAIF